jgi:C_GCAxxG_C_C family probable redox protein
MLPGVEGPLTSVADVRPASSRALRRRSLANLLRMGHCAPTVMKTVLDSYQADAPWLVKLTAGLPGGIGNCGNECGGITSPLVLLGLRHARDPDVAGVPLVVYKGCALLQAFHDRHGTISCRDILGDARLPLRCVGVVRLAPERYLDVRSRDCTGALTGECREACAILHAHHVEAGFHCAHAVLRQAHDTEAVDPALLDATAPFVGGTVYAGLTCSALTAGVMFLGLSLGEIEDSPRRVLRMIGTMAVRGDAFADDLNAFNPVMNLGHELALWFKEQYGSTQCRNITGCDFSTLAGARTYAERGCVERCRGIAREVALRVRGMVQQRIARRR